jgi:hypothetical protein
MDAILLSLPNNVWKTYCFCSISYNSNTSPDNSRGDVIIVIVKKKCRIAIHHHDDNSRGDVIIIRNGAKTISLPNIVWET